MTIVNFPVPQVPQPRRHFECSLSTEKLRYSLFIVTELPGNEEDRLRNNPWGTFYLELIDDLKFKGILSFVVFVSFFPIIYFIDDDCILGVV